MKKNLLALSLLLFPCIASIAQEVSNPIMTAVPSLSIAPDARAGGMGDVGAATTPDINSQYWNPAKYVFMESKGGVSVSYTPWLRKLIDAIDLGYLSGYYKLDQNQAISGSLRYFSLGDISLFDESGYPQSTAHPNEFSLDAAYSRFFSDKFSGAVAMRFIYADLGNGITSEEMYPGMTVAADVAAYYRTPINVQNTEGNLALGLNISNIGGKITYDKDAYNFIPTNLRLGGSFDYPIDNYNRISFSADANKLLVPTPKLNPTQQDNQAYSDMSPITGIFKSFNDAPGGAKEELQEIMWSVGAEYAYNKQFFIRGGYFNESKYKGNRKYFTAGAGFKLNMLQIDAGYIIATTPTNPLDQTLRLSLSFDMEGIKELIK